MKKIRRKNQFIITGLAVMIAVAGYLNFSGKEVTLLQPGSDVDTVRMDEQDAVELEASAKDDEQILYDSDDMLSANPDAASDAMSDNLNDVDEKLTADADDAMISAKVDDAIPEEMAALETDKKDEVVKAEAVSEENSQEEKTDQQSTKETSADVVETAGNVRNRVLQAQLTKEQNRSKNKELLMEIINSDQVSKAEKKNATRQLLQISDFMEKESAAEQVLSAKGYTDCMVSMSEDSVDVMVSLSEISDTDRAKIEDVVQRKTGVSINNIVISSLK